MSCYTSIPGALSGVYKPSLGGRLYLHVLLILRPTRNFLVFSMDLLIGLSMSKNTQVKPGNEARENASLCHALFSTCMTERHRSCSYASVGTSVRAAHTGTNERVRSGGVVVAMTTPLLVSVW